MSYNIDDIRKKLQSSGEGKRQDPDEFRPEKVKNAGDNFTYRFYILPPIEAGQTIKGGQAPKSMDQFFLKHGSHWINNRPNPCPRVWDGAPCEICEFGFDLLKACHKDDKVKRQQIARDWMPSQNFTVNIFFPNVKQNPEALRNTVKWYNAPKTCFDIWTKCLMSDDAGEPDEPKAHGIFFDEYKSWLFQLEITEQGRQNSYKTSRFLASGGSAIPIAKNADGTPNEAAIKGILKLRHDLFSKVELPDPVKIKQLADKVIKGDDALDESTSRGGFHDEEDEQPKQRKAPPLTDDDDVPPVTESKRPLTQKKPPVDDDEAPPVKKESKPAVSTNDEDDSLDSLLASLN